MENLPASSSEVDLGKLFVKIGDFFKDIGYGAVRFLALLRRKPLENRILFSILVLSGAMVGLGYSFFIKKKFYESSMILSSEYLNKRIIDNSIDKLNLLADEETSVGLAKVLRISESLAKNIRKFDASPFVGEGELIETEVLKEQLRNSLVGSKNQNVTEQVIKRIEIENRHAFEFKVYTYSPTAIKPLQDALVSYFKNNDYISKRIQITHDNLVAKRGKLKNELLKLDSLKKIIYSNYKTMAEQTRQGSNNVILSDKAVTNPIEIYNQDLVLYQELESVESRIFLKPDFELVDGFTEFNEPASASRFKIVLIAMLIGFVFGYIVVALKEFDKYLATIK